MAHEKSKERPGTGTEENRLQNLLYKKQERLGDGRSLVH